MPKYQVWVEVDLKWRDDIKLLKQKEYTGIKYILCTSVYESQQQKITLQFYTAWHIHYENYQYFFPATPRFLSHHKYQ